MEQLFVAVGLVVVAVVVAAVVRSRTTSASPAQGKNWTVPAQLHRADFVEPHKPWLVAVFSSQTCLSCADTWSKVAPLASPEVAVQDVTFQAHRELHDRYRIDAVPTLVVADVDGVVRSHFLGPIAAADLWSVLAELRDADEARDA